MNHTIRTEQKFYGLDNLRAFAIIFVLLFHYNRWVEHPAWFPKAFLYSWTGVDLFFVLSGFLIASQLFGQMKKEGSFSIREFYIKRFFRILPIYYFVLAVYFLFPFFSDDFGKGQMLPPLWKFLTFTQNFATDYPHHRSFGMVWSLCVEEHFYLLLPVTLLLLLRTGWFKKSYWLLAILFLAGFLIRWYLWYTIAPFQSTELAFKYLWVETIYLPTYCRLDGLLTGVAIAALYNYLPALFSGLIKYANGMIVSGAIIFISSFFVIGNDYNFIRGVFGFPMVSIGFGLLVFGAIMPGSVLYRWKSAVLTKMAELSYALYLIHMAVILSVQTLFARLGMAKNSNVVFLLSMVSCIAVALVLHYSIEKPFMKMRKRFLKPATNPGPLLPEPEALTIQAS